MDKQLYDLALGNLPGFRDPHKPDHRWKPVAVDQRDNATRNYSVEVEEHPHYVSATVKPHEDKITPLSVPKIKWCDVTKDQFCEEQQKDKTLKAVFARVGAVNGRSPDPARARPGRQAVPPSRYHLSVFSGTA
ncbi:hypothetical protein MTO96_029185 [Rhipicephalus appendiculatus]